jgi:hypothetical protein
MVGRIYDIVGLGFVLGSAFIFYQCVRFLAQADYVAAVIALAAAFTVVRVGVELTRLGIAVGREGQ